VAFWLRRFAVSAKAAQLGVGRKGSGSLRLPKHSAHAAAQRALVEGHAHAGNSLQKLAAMLLTDARLVIFF